MSLVQRLKGWLRPPSPADREALAAEAWAAYQEGERAFAAGRLGRALEAYQRALRLYELELEDPEATVAVALALGEVYAAKGDWRAVQAYVGKALFLLDDPTTPPDPRVVAAAHHRMGDALRQIGMKWNATEYYEEALERYRELGDRYAEAVVCYDLGTVLDARGKPEAAIPYLQRAIEIFEALGKLQEAAAAWNALGTLWAEGEAWDEALEAFRRDVELCRQVGDPGALGLALNDLGVALTRAKRFEEADPAFEEARTRLEAAGDRRGRAILDLNQAVLRAYQGAREEALALARRAVEAFRELDDPDRLQEARAVLKMIADNRLEETPWGLFFHF